MGGHHRAPGHDEQLRTLAQMSEEDRLVVQRLMDASSVQAPGARDAPWPEVICTA